LAGSSRIRVPTVLESSRALLESDADAMQAPRRFARSLRSGQLGPLLAIAILAVGTAGCASHANPTVPSAPDTGRVGLPPPAFLNFQDQPCWSGSGRIAYRDNGIVCVNDAGIATVDTRLAGLWVIDAASGAKRRIWPRGDAPSWSPDGSAIAFEDHDRLFTVQLDSTGLQELAPGMGGFFPRWSHDGTSIAFDTVPTSAHTFSAWRVASDGTDPRKLLDGRTPSWSPGDDRVLAAAEVDSAGTWLSEILSCDVATGAVSTIWSRPGVGVWQPVFSPDGTQIAFRAAIGSRLPQVWLIDASGRNLRQVTALGGSAPAWSPDGRTIAYVRSDWTTDGDGYGAIWLHRLDTGDEVRLTTRWPTYCTF
jgi:dipeptidyl aminopeptidase/acylaminoacyl peptidase